MILHDTHLPIPAYLCLCPTCSLPCPYLQVLPSSGQAKLPSEMLHMFGLLKNFQHLVTGCPPRSAACQGQGHSYGCAAALGSGEEEQPECSGRYMGSASGAWPGADHPHVSSSHTGGGMSALGSKSQSLLESVQVALQGRGSVAAGGGPPPRQVGDSAAAGSAPPPPCVPPLRLPAGSTAWQHSGVPAAAAAAAGVRACGEGEWRCWQKQQGWGPAGCSSCPGGVGLRAQAQASAPSRHVC